MMPRYGIDTTGTRRPAMDTAGAWILHIKSEVLDTIQCNTLPLFFKYPGIIASKDKGVKHCHQFKGKFKERGS